MLSSVKDIYNAVLPNMWSTRFSLRNMDNSTILIFDAKAGANPKIFGACTLKYHIKSYVEVALLGVIGSRQNKHAGTELIEATKRLALLGHHTALITWAANTATRFFEKVGFAALKKEHNDFSTIMGLLKSCEDATAMYLPLMDSTTDTEEQPTEKPKQTPQSESSSDYEPGSLRQSKKRKSKSVEE